MKKILQQPNDNISNQHENIAMLTFAEACQYLKVSKSFLYKATSDRAITFFKPTGGKLIYFDRDDLDAWLTKNRFPSKTELDNSNNGGLHGYYRF